MRGCLFEAWEVASEGHDGMGCGLDLSSKQKQ